MVMKRGRFGHGTQNDMDKPTVLQRARSVGIAGNVEALQLWLAAAIGVYDQILATAPEQFKPLVTGAGEKRIAMARAIMESV